MTDSVMKWYVVRAIGGQENKVKSYIETEIARVGLSDFVSQVIVPTEKVIQIRNGKKVNREKVYFPGYIMIEANLSGEVPHVIKSITGVIGFLGETKGGDPVPIPRGRKGRGDRGGPVRPALAVGLSPPEGFQVRWGERRGHVPPAPFFFSCLCLPVCSARPSMP